MTKELLKRILEPWDSETPRYQQYEIEVTDEGNGIQIKIKGQEDGLYLEAFFEIDRGGPAFHVWGTEGGDALLHAHRTQGGLIVNPERSDEVEKVPDPIYSDKHEALLFPDYHIQEEGK